MKFKPTIIIEKLIENCVSSGLLAVHIKQSRKLVYFIFFSLKKNAKLPSDKTSTGCPNKHGNSISSF